MNFNATLIGQMIAFAVFVWFTMKFVWTPMTKALDERKNKIAEGLAAAERGQHEQELAQERARERLHEAKQQVNEIIAQAQKRSNEILEEARVAAREEGERLKAAAHAEIEMETNRAREQLRKEIAALVIAGTEQILKREVNAEAHAKVMEDLIEEI
jgi:F-type H+-transporting ATPase subunit b